MKSNFLKAILLVGLVAGVLAGCDGGQAGTEPPKDSTTTAAGAATDGKPQAAGISADQVGLTDAGKNADAGTGSKLSGSN